MKWVWVGFIWLVGMLDTLWQNKRMMKSPAEGSSQSLLVPARLGQGTGAALLQDDCLKWKFPREGAALRRSVCSAGTRSWVLSPVPLLNK